MQAGEDRVGGVVGRQQEVLRRVRLGVRSRTEALRAAGLDDHPSWTTPTDRGHGT